MIDDSIRYPSDFHRWHDIRLKQYKTVLEEELRKENALQASAHAYADRIQRRINNVLQCKNDREIGRFLVCPARIELTIAP